MSLSKSQRIAIREMFGCRCAYCGHPLGERWHADHIQAIMRKTEWLRDEKGKRIVENGRMKVRVIGAWNPENERIDNYFPACVPCNIDKNCMDIETWRKSLQDKINVALRASTPLRHAKRFGLVHFSDDPIVFYFEKVDSSDELLSREPKEEV